MKTMSEAISRVKMRMTLGLDLGYDGENYGGEDDHGDVYDGNGDGDMTFLTS